MDCIRTENEIKMYASEGPFSYDGDDPTEKMLSFKAIFEDAGFTTSEITHTRHTDYYYVDTEGVFDRDGILLRYRDTGDKAFLTLKAPTIVDSLGLSRKEIEGETIRDSRFDRWNVVQDYAAEHYGPVDILKEPKLRVDVVRGRILIKSDVRRYNFSFDKVVYSDPASAVRSMPCYEIEFENLEESISDDVRMGKLVYTLSETYMFEEEKISKYARGMAFLRSVQNTV